MKSGFISATFRSPFRNQNDTFLLDDDRQLGGNAVVELDFRRIGAVSLDVLNAQLSAVDGDAASVSQLTAKITAALARKGFTYEEIRAALRRARAEADDETP